MRCSGLLEPALSLLSRCVWADERQLEPWPRDRRSAGIVAPAQLEQVSGLLDHDGFPPRRPSALGFGQHEMADIDVVPIFGQRLGVGGEICRDRFVVFCLAWLSVISRFPPRFGPR